MDKLHRQGITLRGIQDLAGARIIVNGGRQEQDKARDSILAGFEHCPRPPFVIDRREEPSFGYRAVHIIIYEEHLPIEVQIRTILQDTWAQMLEKLGDMWGRQIRYGGQPNDPDSPTFPDEPDSRSRRSMLELMMWISAAINQVEAFQIIVPKLQEAAVATDVSEESKRQLYELIRNAATTADNTIVTMEERVGNLLAIVNRLEARR